MTRFTMTSWMASAAAALALTLVAGLSTADAQNLILSQGGAIQTSPVVPVGGYQGGYGYGNGYGYGYDPGYRGPYWNPQRPSIPVGATPNVVTGYNPWTGGVNTGNTQFNNTFYDYGRDGSINNGTRRWVNRPVYDAYGNITGYQQGQVWNNSLTGQEHGQLDTITPNGQGGQHNTTVLYSTAQPPAGGNASGGGSGSGNR